jgi:hypothetical protein
MKPTARETAAAHRLAEAMLEFLSARDEAADIRRRESQERSAPEAAPRLTGWNKLNEEETRERGLLSTRDAARFLGISERYLWEISSPRGPVPCVRMRNVVRYDPADLKQAVERFKQAPSTEGTDEDRDKTDHRGKAVRQQPAAERRRGRGRR